MSGKPMEATAETVRIERGERENCKEKKKLFKDIQKCKNYTHFGERLRKFVPFKVEAVVAWYKSRRGLSDDVDDEDRARRE